MSPAEFFAPWEPDPVCSLDDFFKLLESTFSKWSSVDRDAQYAWRGVINAEYPLHSSLYRRMKWTNASHTKETDLSDAEGAVLRDAHRWGLHYADRAHLPVLYELASLQHFGAPTRLLDVSFNPLIALWFAVEDQRDDRAQPLHADKDGRLVIFDVSDRMINESSATERMWEESFSRPWNDDRRPNDWTTRSWAWRPAPIEARFAAQAGGFVFGGVPATGGGLWRKGPGSTQGWSIAEVRDCVSIATKFTRLETLPGRPANHPAFTVRIGANSKEEIREDLRAWFDLDSRTVYPDHAGFGAFGNRGLAKKPAQ